MFGIAIDRSWVGKASKLWGETLKQESTSEISQNSKFVTEAVFCFIAIEQYDKRFVVNFGTEIFPENYSGSAELTQELRDALASLKWEIWEREGLFSRDSLPENFREQFIKTFEKRLQPWDTLESVERTRFHTKAEIEQKNAFTHLDKLIPCWENAFLFRK